MHEMANEAIRHTLSRWAGDTPDSSAIAEAALSTWAGISGRLELVIGSRGVNALFNRAVQVSCQTYPWLTTMSGEEDMAAQLAGLRSCLRGRDPVEAEEASYVLLMTFTVLLTNLLGDSLSKRLLEPVWDLPSARPQVERR